MVKSRNALMDAAYDDEVYVDERTIDSHIKRLRRKFKAHDVEFDMVETLYGGHTRADNHTRGSRLAALRCLCEALDKS